MNGVAIEAATSRVEVAVHGEAGLRAHEAEEVGHGHARRLIPLVSRALERAGIEPSELRWVAADLGPGSFTGVRVGLATARALALAAGAQVLGASSLASLATCTEARRTLVCPLVPAGRRDSYVGFFRAGSRGNVSLAAAPFVGALEPTLAAIGEARGALGSIPVRCVGPGVPRWREPLERAFPGSTVPEWRFEGLSALDLAAAARSGRGPAAGLPGGTQDLQPLYVRSAQAEERVRHRVAAAEPVSLRPFLQTDVRAAAAAEQRIFPDPWPESFFRGELGHPLAYARVAERGGRLVGYSVAWLGAGAGHLGNLAVVPEERRRGVARALVADLLERARERRVPSLTLEVRVSNFAAQWLYRAYGFRLAGLRHGYYRDTGEDALIMDWCPERH
ncbi:MAG TPA: tRNA (adenosine(37)-N6)-threonylcarbamoyltransferase complex dimerization subunit type 1 TsaB [Candidatus Eisenbacteria bacterium]